MHRAPLDQQRESHLDSRTVAVEEKAALRTSTTAHEMAWSTWPAPGAKAPRTIPSVIRRQPSAPAELRRGLEGEEDQLDVNLVAGGGN